MPESRFLSANDLNLHYVDWGGAPGPPVVLLHGGSASTHWWDWVAPELAKRYRVVALDFRGHGESEHSDPPYHTRNFVDDLEALIRGLDLGRPAIVGHSMGGHVAYAHAAHHPESVGALITVDSTMDLPADVLKKLRARAGRPARRHESLEAAIERFYLMPPEETVQDDVRRALGTHMFKQESDGKWITKSDRRSADRELIDVPSLLPTLSCPTLIVRAEKSTVVTPDSWKRTIELIPGAKGVEIPDVSHHFILDHPEPAHDCIHSFLSTCEDFAA